MTPDTDDAASDAAETTLSVEANGLEFGCLRVGDGDRLALCLHGFPDDAGSLRPLAARLADAGYTAVSPYMRGYHPTDPAPDGDYSARALGADAVALADALGERLDLSGDPVVVGHDWGAVAVYAAAAQDPEAFERAAAMAVPPRFQALLWSHPRQVLRSWYVWAFQFPGAERALHAGEFALVRFLWETWSPGWEYDPERLAAVRATFRRGDTAANALAYYRDAVGDAVSDLRREGVPDLAAGPTLRVPTLVLTGERDRCIGRELYAHAGDAFESARVAVVRDAGHFVHRERPDVVADEVVSFFERG